MSSYLPVVVTKRARSQIERATTWWREERPASPEALVEELSRVFDLLSVAPMLGQPASRGTRRVLPSGCTTFCTTAIGQMPSASKSWHFGILAE